METSNSDINDMEVLKQRLDTMEERQKDFVLREVFDIIREDVKETKALADQNRATNLKLIGALVLFKVVYAPFVFFLLDNYWASGS